MNDVSQLPPWQDKVINPAQLGGIETAVLDDGPGRGVRVAWVNTGTPLRYKVVIDRGMDIVDAFYGGRSLAWLSHAGITAAKADADRNLEWLYSFAGGLLTTCGLTHIGGPEADDAESRGLHGRISNQPATIESVKQPDLSDQTPEMSLAGTVRESRLFGPNLELRRHISSRLGEAVIRIHDRVTNRGNTPTPHMLLYHCNFGWPLVDVGAAIVWSGQCRSRGGEADDRLFATDHDYRRCSQVLDDHRGSGEACGFVNVEPDAAGFCTVGIRNPKLDLAVAMRYPKSQLPWLTNWQHWGAGEYVMALEPGTNPPIGQNQARQDGELIILEPGESRCYDLELRILPDPEESFTETA